MVYDYDRSSLSVMLNIDFPVIMIESCACAENLIIIIIIIIIIIMIIIERID